jgi:hypothetical protein
MSMRDAGAGTRGYMSAMDRRIRNKKTAQKAAENTKQFEANKKRTKKLENRLRKLEQGQSKAAAAPAKPATPENKSQKIAPVQQSNQMQQAKDYTQAYEKKDYSSIFKQNETDYTAKFQPSASGSSGPQKDPQEFADKYKLDLINSGATKQTDTTPSQPMSGADILKKDKEQYGSYM